MNAEATNLTGYTNIVATALKAEGFDLSEIRGHEGIEFYFHADNVFVRVEFKSRKIAGTYKQYKNHYTVIVGRYGEAKRFSLRKDGTFNMPAIVAEIRARAAAAIEAKKVEERRANARGNAEAAVAAAVEEGLASRFDPRLRINQYGTVEVSLKVTAEQLKSLLEALAAAGFGSK